MRCSIIFSLLVVASAVSAEPALEFRRSGVTISTKTLSELTAAVKPKTVELHDPIYGKTKRFECLPVRPLMDYAYGAQWRSFPETEATLIASDGYASQASAAKLSEDGGCVAFRDLDVPGWEPVGHRKANPAPFYLFWEKPEQSTENAYPWPYQLTTIDLVSFEKAYPEVVPRGAKKDSAAWRGYQTFRARCMRCHAINRQGGTLGPDLNAPMPITKYRTKAWLKSWIKQPSKYRYTQMPDHLDLSDAQLDDVYEYFRWKEKQPEKPAF